MRAGSGLFGTSTFALLDYRYLVTPAAGTFLSYQTGISNLDIERVEVVRGSNSASFGPGVTSGVVHFLSKSAIDRPGTSVEAYVGELNTTGYGLRHAYSNESKTFGIKYEIHKEAFKILEAYYKPGEFNEGRQKMCWMPENANLILNPTSGAPGFNVENVFCLPGVPSILKSMLGGLTNTIVGGEPIKSHTISLRTVESEIANSLTKVQNDNQDVEIGSYPFFHAGKLGVSIVIRSEDQSKIDLCNSQILKFVNAKKIEVVER